MYVKIVSWNVNGLRARVKKGFEFNCRMMSPDIICLQETKVARDEMPSILPGYYCYLNPAEQRGYSGTALFTKRRPICVWFGMPPLGNAEGRIIVAEYYRFVLVNVYSPHSGFDLSRLDGRAWWDKEFADKCCKIAAVKPVIIAGDFNVAHHNIAASSARRKKSAGFTPVERRAFGELLSRRFLDAYRYLHKDADDELRMDWRLDYMLIDRSLAADLKSATIEQYVGSSDHWPLTMTLWIPL